MASDYSLHKEEIHEYIMFQLHTEFFYNEDPSMEEIDFQHKIELMQELPPEAYGIPANMTADSVETKFAWKQAIKQI